MGATTAGLNIAFTFSNGISLNLLESTASITKMGGGGDTCDASSSDYCVVDLGSLGMNFVVTSN
tara:strand:- start:1821 stop:2012 length:192 start_codon:yes stop_codon:yes gene_type:complete